MVKLNAGRRRYNQFCPVARGLDYVGERWTLLLVRELMLGPKRFKDLLDGLPGIATNLLASRLKEMERDGIIARRMLPPPASTAAYELTEIGRGLEPVVFAIGRWGHQFLSTGEAGDALRPGWLIASLRASFHPDAARRRREVFELWIDGVPFHVVVSREEVRAGQGPATDPAVVLRMDATTLRRLLSGDLSQPIRDGSVDSGGDNDALQRFVEMFRWQAPMATQAPGK